MDLSAVFESSLGLPPRSLEDPGEASLQGLLEGRTKNPEPKQPVAANAMRRALASLPRPVLQKWFWPDGKAFAAFASHDVDETRWSWRRRLLMGARHPRTLAERNDRYWNFDRVLDLEGRFGIRSSWYFVADGTHPRDPPYRLPDVAPVMRELDSKGQEVGVHGSYLSYRDGPKLRRERQAVAEVLGRDISGVRQHFVNFEPGTTWRLQREAGFAYDASLAVNEVSGFRTGMCHPYTPPGESILEIPLLLMDGQLFWHEGFSVDDALKNSLHIADLVARQGGLLTLDWHQHTFDGYSFPGWWDVYEKILQWLSGHDALFMTGEEVWRWWTLRASVSLSATSRSATSAEWAVAAATDVRGLGLRAGGAPSASLSTDAPHSSARVQEGEILVLDHLRPGEPASVHMEW